MAQMVGHLPSKHKALSWTTVSPKKKKKTKAVVSKWIPFPAYH
jgi:hypothetical protein